MNAFTIFIFPPTLHDSLGHSREQYEWKDEITLFLPIVLQEINDEVMVLQNTHKKIEKIMYVEYDMKGEIINMETYVEEEYTFHLFSINLFISQTIDTKNIEGKTL
jgi:hypothetical protein